MKPVWIVGLFLSTILFTSGCGTILNLRSGDPEVYGGVAKDLEFIMTPSAGGGGGSPGLLVLIAGEVGLSLVGDTVTLPVVKRKMRKDDGSMEPKAGAPGETTRGHVLRQFRRRSPRLPGSEKGETMSPLSEDVSLDKPQPLDSPKQP